jgi:hypothetical protein
VSGAASGAKIARTVAGTLAWSRIRVSTVPAGMQGETTTALTRGPSRVKSKAEVLRCQMVRLLAMRMGSWTPASARWVNRE